MGACGEWFVYVSQVVDKSLLCLNDSRNYQITKTEHFKQVPSELDQNAMSGKGHIDDDDCEQLAPLVRVKVKFTVKNHT